ncbi:MAG: hypothetical protein OXI30_18545 [Chloroflexota bacterium]|nr:hypothetical protein [Chloroflexota bacterium]
MNFGVRGSKSEGETETLNLHHYLLTAIMDALFKKGKAVDLNQTFKTGSVDANLVRTAVKKHQYVRVEGTSEFQIFQNIQRLTSGMIEILPVLGDKSSNRQERKAQKERLEAFSRIIDMIWPGRNHLAIQPFEDFTEFKVYSNLKVECFVDPDVDNVIFHYGSKPNISLTVFGLCTSRPSGKPRSESLFAQGASQSGAKGAAEIAAGIQQMFSLIAPLEQVGQLAHYPSIVVYPVAVYRTIADS